jgi:hypothetical protein
MIGGLRVSHIMFSDEVAAADGEGRGTHSVPELQVHRSRRSFAGGEGPLSTGRRCMRRIAAPSGPRTTRPRRSWQCTLQMGSFLRSKSKREVKHRRPSEKAGRKKKRHTFCACEKGPCVKRNSYKTIGYDLLNISINLQLWYIDVDMHVLS